MDLESIRREYLQGELSEETTKKTPLAQFEFWLQQAVDAKLRDPTAMTVATVDATGQPSQRIVLLKHLDSDGFVFFTNLNSRKGQDIHANAKVSLHFPWHVLERQVKIQGVAEKISTKDVFDYFTGRPYESQLAAWASKQSERVDSRSLLMMQFNAMKKKFLQGKVPVPDAWGGYRVKPHLLEFWQGGANRLHDRICYESKRGLLLGDEGWEKYRLAP